MLLSPDDPWAGYERTIVRIGLWGAGDLEIRSAAPGQAGTWPWPSEDAVHLLTAWDPGGERPGPTVNRARQEALESDLRAMGSGWAREIRAAEGLDPHTGDHDEGVAVRGAPEHEVLAIAERYGQDAIFAWTPSVWSIVACRGERRVSLGWTVTRRRDLT